MRELAAGAALVLTLAGWCFWLAAWWLAEAFFGRAPASEGNGATPGISVLKPLRGVDAEAVANFESFCRQDYPRYQVLFGAVDADDPVLPVVAGLPARHPELDVQLHLVAEGGGNPKANLLHQLAREARYDVLVTSDSDIRVPADFLRRAVEPLHDPTVGLVTFPYRGASPVTFTARLEALHMSGTFLPWVLVGRSVLGMRFALGASLALRRADLERIGGFAAVAPYLADDYQLGRRIARLGLRVRLSRTVVASVLGATSFGQQWQREVRWARTTRVSRPLEYPALLVTHTLPLALAYVVLDGARPASLLVLVVSLALRLFVAGRVTARSGAGDLLRWLPWLPVRDLLSGAIWVVGLAGNGVTWRGRGFRVSRDGRLVGGGVPRERDPGSSGPSPGPEGRGTEEAR
jgi:ceramide glucosyltransferase